MVALTPIQAFGRGAGDLPLPVLRAALAERWEADLAVQCTADEALARAKTRIRLWGGARR